MKRRIIRRDCQLFLFGVVAAVCKLCRRQRVACECRLHLRWNELRLYVSTLLNQIERGRHPFELKGRSM
jgi:hypothetical protein